MMIEKKAWIQMKKAIWGMVGILLLFLAGVGGAQDYVVGQGDVLTITVYDNDDLTTTARVSTSGAISIPLVGQVQVAGLQVSQAGKKISDLYADGYLIDPQVTVFIKEFRSRKATILGEVKNPGLHELQGNISFLEVVSSAGGFTSGAGDVAVIKRQKNGDGTDQDVIVIDLKRLVEQGDLSQDLPIQNGDRIYVKKASVFYVSGEVKKPDAYKYEQGTTIIKAITLAGGFSDKASTGKVRIVRKEGDKETVFDAVKMDETVLPDDVIVVPESFF
jgi:polysaccharide biosynthesis/export protein